MIKTQVATASIINYIARNYEAGNAEWALRRVVQKRLPYYADAALEMSQRAKNPDRVRVLRSVRALALGRAAELGSI